eukprot:665626-Alexandrium_andersonii.AAC.1
MRSSGPAVRPFGPRSLRGRKGPMLCLVGMWLTDDLCWDPCRRTRPRRGSPYWASSRRRAAALPGWTGYPMRSSSMASTWWLR